jgi:signal transduction histidine kinase
MKLSTQIMLAFLLVLLLSMFDTGSNYLLSLKVERNSDFLNRSHEIIRNSASLHKKMIDMQSSFRGYLLTDDDSFLVAYRNGLISVPKQFPELKKLLTPNSTQLTLIDSIEILHHRWINYAASLIQARRNLHSEDAIGTYRVLFENQLKRQIGKKINDDISKTFAEFDSIEYDKRELHGDNLSRSIRTTHTYSLIFFTLTIVIGVSTALYIVYRISKRIKTMVSLAQNISEGRFTTLKDKSNDELTHLSFSLNRMSESLQHNINELENRNVELDKFAYAVSHDLKAPIRGIHNVINWTEEDLSAEISPQMRKHLDIIRDRTKRMENLINGLLDYARIRRKSPPELINVKDLVNQIVETIVPRNYTVEMDDLPVIYTERSKLEQIFENLISNAMKYSSGNNGYIGIRSRELADHYEFSVKDNGMGIDPEYHSRIFEMFQTLREKDEKESTGIGLALIKKILDDQNCTIRVESALGKGSEFIFTWPRNMN